MGASDKVQSQTNTQEKSCKDVHCDCNAMWSLVQEQCTKRMCKLHGKQTGNILNKFNVRARRIAATYARFYLEQEQSGNAEFKGRFYWMSLGAFASKTVACSLELLRVQLLPPVFDGLGKGNFWLFQDISGWHWYYTRYNGSVDTCFEKRDASSYLHPVQSQMKHYPWKDEALPKINNMKISEHVKKGFQKVKEFENEVNDQKKASIQMANLLAIADHEQRVILQHLIYNDRSFSRWIGVQRSALASWASPELSLAFSSACDTKEAHLKSIAPDDTVLEDEVSRMVWITKAANQFHSLMQKNSEYMEEQLHTIASWVGMEDPEPPSFTSMPLMPRL